MKTKQQYTAPTIRIIPLITEAEVAADFIISSKSVGEDDALAKPGFFDDVEDEEIETPRPWGDISY